MQSVKIDRVSTLMDQAQESQYNPMQKVKRHFFAMRNGVIADTMRTAGAPFKIIFGLNLPQIVEIASNIGPSKDLAKDLWHNTTTRESMLLAPMLVPHDDFSKVEAREWIKDIPYPEVADILCHRLLRHMPYAVDLAEELVQPANEDMERYTGVRLAFNIYMKNADAARRIVKIAREDAKPLFANLTEALNEELNWV